MTYPIPPPDALDAPILPADRQLATAVIERVFKARGLLLNPGRLALIDVLFDAPEPLDVEGALAAARANGNIVSRAAVTRFLSLLTRLGVTEVVGRRNARRFYRLRSQARTIALSCLRQNRIIEVQDDALVEAVDRMLGGLGYRLAEGIDFRVEPADATAGRTLSGKA